jgi:DNA-directed RNA polymerase subunit F
MFVLDQLASALGRNDEIPNQELAAQLVESRDAEAIQELVDNLTNKNKAIRSDCIKVLYEVGAIKPELIADYIDEFVALLSSRDNRLVWGSMTALGSVAPIKPQAIWRHIDSIMDATTNGSVITQDWGVRVLATVAVVDVYHAQRIFPYLLDFLKGCRPKDVPRHAESIIIAVTPQNSAQFRSILESHKPNLKPAQIKRVGRLLKQVE